MIQEELSVVPCGFSFRLNFHVYVLFLICLHLCISESFSRLELIRNARDEKKTHKQYYSGHESAILLLFSPSDLSILLEIVEDLMLQVRLLGQFDLSLNKKRITIPSRVGQSLFAYLVLGAGTSHRREKL